MSKNLIARIIVAAIFIPVILWISYAGGWWLYGMVMFFAACAMSEFLIAEGYSIKRPAFWLVLVAVLLMVDSPSLRLFGRWIRLMSDLMPIGGVGTSWLAAFRSYVFLFPIFLAIGVSFATGKESPAKLFEKTTRLFWGAFYVGMLYPFVYFMGAFAPRVAESQLGFRGYHGIIDTTLQIEGGDALLFLFALLWIGDTAAMWVGKSFGKHKLAPSVSPNKTVEGFIGGLVSAGIVGLAMGLWKFNQFPLYQIIILGVICSLFGQLGDLVESMWKRSLNLKDSSAIIPGHGGFLDRFDSLLFAAPVMYYYFVIFR